jgi:hypothetical protein
VYNFIGTEIDSNIKFNRTHTACDGHLEFFLVIYFVSAYNFFEVMSLTRDKCMKRERREKKLFAISKVQTKRFFLFAIKLRNAKPSSIMLLDIISFAIYIFVRVQTVFAVLCNHVIIMMADEKLRL